MLLLTFFLLFSYSETSGVNGCKLNRKNLFSGHGCVFWFEGCCFFFNLASWRDACQQTYRRREMCRKCAICPNIIFRAARELTDRYQSDTLAREGLNNILLRLKHHMVNLLHLQVQINVNTNSKNNNFQNDTFSSFPPQKNWHKQVISVLLLWYCCWHQQCTNCSSPRHSKIKMRFKFTFSTSKAYVWISPPWQSDWMFHFWLPK